MFTGPGVYCHVPVYKSEPGVHQVDFPEVNPPDFSKTDWKCAFIQSTSADRKLKPETQFLYCKLKFMDEDKDVPQRGGGHVISILYCI